MTEQTTRDMSIKKIRFYLSSTYMTYLFLWLEEFLITKDAYDIFGIILKLALRTWNSWNFNLDNRFFEKSFTHDTSMCILVVLIRAYWANIFITWVNFRPPVLTVCTFRTRIHIFTDLWITVRTNPTRIVQHFYY